MIRKTARILLILATVVVALLTFHVVRSRRSGRPQRAGTASIPGLTHPVDVRYDKFGVPSIAAANLDDLLAALGWVHANDRFTQMETQRRAAAGRLSEIFGKLTVDSDRSFRELRGPEIVAAMWRHSSPESRRWLTAYARGVNAWLTAHRGDLPPELALLGARPEAWRAADCLSVIFLMANDLSFWQGRPEEGRLVMLARLGLDKTSDLVGGPPLEIAPGLSPWLSRIGRPRRIAPGGEAPRGSNDWAIGATRTATGAPIVANDPHLGLRLPSTWFQVNLRSPDLVASGMTLPGLPVVAVGQTPDLAWALTNTMLDDHDLFLEEVDPARASVRRGSSSQAIRTRRERIQVRFGRDVEIELRATDRGFLLPAEPAWNLPARSLAWTLSAGGDPVAPFIALMTRTSIAEVRPRIGTYVGPAQNLAIAERGGRLFMTPIGLVPDRPFGDGRLPVPAAIDRYAWRGLRPQSWNPVVVEPRDDLVVTANDDIRPAGYARAFPAEFDAPYRAERIRDRIEARSGWTARDVAALQSDTVSLYALEIARLLRGRYPGDAGRAATMLAAWDGAMDPTSAPAALFGIAEREVARAIFADDLASAGLPYFAQRPTTLARVLRGETKADWFDDLSTPRHESRQETVATALGRAWQIALRTLGDRPERWRYDQLRTLKLQGLFGFVPLLGGWINRGPFPVAGSANSIDALAGDVAEDGREAVTGGPSMRFVADLADGGRSLAMLPGGQSGHPGDPHYDDQIAPFLAGEMRPVAWSETAQRQGAISTLRLLAASAGN